MKRMVKTISLFLAALMLIFSFTSCRPKENPPEKSAFVLQNDFSQRDVKVGEKVTYKVILKNLTDDTHTLKHTEPLIKMSIVAAEDEENVISEEIIERNTAESGISPNGQIEEFFDFIPEKEGKYILKASCEFSIDGKDYDEDYQYKCVDLRINVTK